MMFQANVNNNNNNSQNKMKRTILDNNTTWKIV